MPAADVLSPEQRASLADLSARGQLRLALPEPAERRAIRRAARVRVVELADVLGVSRHLLHSWESGRREPRAGAREKYAAALQTLRGGGEINQ